MSVPVSIAKAIDKFFVAAMYAMIGMYEGSRWGTSWAQWCPIFVSMFIGNVLWQFVEDFYLPSASMRAAAVSMGVRWRSPFESRRSLRRRLELAASPPQVGTVRALYTVSGVRGHEEGRNQVTVIMAWWCSRRRVEEQLDLVRAAHALVLVERGSIAKWSEW